MTFENISKSKNVHSYWKPIFCSYFSWLTITIHINYPRLTILSCGSGITCCSLTKHNSPEITSHQQHWHWVERQYTLVLLLNNAWKDTILDAKYLLRTFHQLSMCIHSPIVYIVGLHRYVITTKDIDYRH